MYIPIKSDGNELTIEYLRLSNVYIDNIPNKGRGLRVTKNFEPGEVKRDYQS